MTEKSPSLTAIPAADQSMLQNPTSSRRKALFGLRGVACLAVLITHAIALSSSQALIAETGIPKIGVWLFFVLSAFLLTQNLMMPSALSSRGILFYAYYRFLRIVPLFVLAVALYLLTGTLIMSPAAAIAALTFQSTPGHFWTIPVELGFYLSLPVVVGLMLTVARGRVWRGAVTLGALVVAATIVWPPFSTPYSSTEPMWYAINFGTGVFAGYLVVSGWRINFPAWTIAACCITIVAIVILNRIGFIGDANWLLDKHYLFGPIFGIIIMALHGTPGYWHKLLSAPWLVRIGEASFSIYLFHFGICMRAGVLPFFVAVPSAIVASIAVGLLSFRFVERPLYSLRKFDRPIAAANGWPSRSPAGSATLLRPHRPPP